MASTSATNNPLSTSRKWRPCGCVWQAQAIIKKGHEGWWGTIHEGYNP